MRTCDDIGFHWKIQQLGQSGSCKTEYMIFSFVIMYPMGVILLFFHFFQAELFSCPTEKKEALPKLKIPYILAKEGSHCDYLILWLDCDKEGENICFEVINAVQQGMHRKLHPNVSPAYIIYNY